MPVIKNPSILHGKELEFIDSAWVGIENGRFAKIGRAAAGGDRDSAGAGDGYRDPAFDAEGLLMIPGMINAHTHVADSIAKDIASDANDLNQIVHPVHGIKRSILSKTDEKHLAAYMQASALSMLRKGITTFADFREGGPNGVALLKSALDGLEIRCVSLGRIEYYFTAESARKNAGLPSDVKREAELVIERAAGFGISGANEYSDSALQYLAGRARQHGKLLGIHAAEAEESVRCSRENFGASEVTRIVENVMPNFVVHMTNASDEDIRLAASKNIGIVVCPRANGVLGVGVPRIGRMLRNGCVLAIGTDNIMLNSPDLFRELDYIWKASRALEDDDEAVPAKQLLKMVTVNPAEFLKLDGLGFIAEGMTADAVFIDKHSLDIEPMHDPYLSIIHRATESSIRAVMIGGRIVHGTL